MKYLGSRTSAPFSTRTQTSFSLTLPYILGKIYMYSLLWKRVRGGVSIVLLANRQQLAARFSFTVSACSLCKSPTTKIVCKVSCLFSRQL